MEFIELFLMEADGRSQLDHGAHYKGIYSLKEKIKRSSKRVAISKMDPTNATDVEGGYLLVMSSSSHDGMLNTGGPQKHKVSDLGPARVKFAIVLWGCSGSVRGKGCNLSLSLTDHPRE